MAVCDLLARSLEPVALSIKRVVIVAALKGCHEDCCCWVSQFV